MGKEVIVQLKLIGSIDERGVLRLSEFLKEDVCVFSKNNTLELCFECPDNFSIYNLYKVNWKNLWLS